MEQEEEKEKRKSQRQKEEIADLFCVGSPARSDACCAIG